MERSKWTERVFVFNLPEGWMSNTLERLYGAIPRLKELTANIIDKEAELKFNNKWSIKQHIGHLHDLEALHLGRIHDFIDKHKILRAADLTNAETERANHNKNVVANLVNVFELGRNELISHFAELDAEVQARVAFHPRLKINMKPVDMAAFVCEHDDHHLAHIRDIIRNIKEGSR